MSRLCKSHWKLKPNHSSNSNEWLKFNMQIFGNNNSRKCRSNLHWRITIFNSIGCLNKFHLWVIAYQPLHSLLSRECCFPFFKGWYRWRATEITVSTFLHWKEEEFLLLGRDSVKSRTPSSRTSSNSKSSDGASMWAYLGKTQNT